MSEFDEPIDIRIQGYKAVLETDSETGFEDRVAATVDTPKMPTDLHPANLMSSLCTDGKHHPAIDIDIPVRLIPSSTEEHYHLTFPTIALDWNQYMDLLAALVRAGIVGEGYFAHTKIRGSSWLRLPHVKKESTE